MKYPARLGSSRASERNLSSLGRRCRDPFTTKSALGRPICRTDGAVDSSRIHPDKNVPATNTAASDLSIRRRLVISLTWFHIDTWLHSSVETHCYITNADVGQFSTTALYYSHKAFRQGGTWGVPCYSHWSQYAHVIQTTSWCARRISWSSTRRSTQPCGRVQLFELNFMPIPAEGRATLPASISQSGRRKTHRLCLSMRQASSAPSSPAPSRWTFQRRISCRDQPYSRTSLTLQSSRKWARPQRVLDVAHMSARIKCVMIYKPYCCFYH